MFWYLFSGFRCLFWDLSCLILLRLFSCHNLNSESFFIQQCLCILFRHTTDIRYCDLAWFIFLVLSCNSTKWFKYACRLTNSKYKDQHDDRHNYDCKYLHDLMHMRIDFICPSATFIILIIFVVVIISIHGICIILICIILFCIILFIIISIPDIIQIFVCHDNGICHTTDWRDHYKIPIRIDQWMLQILNQSPCTFISSLWTFLRTFQNDLLQTVRNIRYEFWRRCNLLLQMLHCNFYRCLPVKWNLTGYHFE